jgi:hypothetical protein
MEFETLKVDDARAWTRRFTFSSATWGPISALQAQIRLQNIPKNFSARGVGRGSILDGRVRAPIWPASRGLQSPSRQAGSKGWIAVTIGERRTTGESESPWPRTGPEAHQATAGQG